MPNRRNFRTLDGTYFLCFETNALTYGNRKRAAGKGNTQKPSKRSKIQFLLDLRAHSRATAGYELFDFHAKPQEISFQDFAKNYLADHDVARLDVINGRQVEVYIKQDRLNQPKFKDVARNNLGNLNPGPHYVFTIGNIETFNQELAAAEKQYNIAPEEIDVTYHDRGDWFTPFVNIAIPLLIFVALWIFLMRKMGGSSSGGGPGGIFNIGKSRAQLFEKGTRVNVTFNDVAGLDEAKQEVMEVVDFLRNPKNTPHLVAKSPKVLCW